MKNIRNIAILLFLFTAIITKAQSTGHFNTVKDYETALRPLSKKLLKAKTDEERNEANKNFIKLFEEALQLKESFLFNFDSLINLKVLNSDDNKLRVYTWVMPAVDNNSYQYYGYVQVKIKKPGLAGFFNKEFFINTIKLKDGTAEIPDPENSKLKPDRWFGAWYYKIIANKYLGKKQYTLLGWKGNNKLIAMKVIDCINISTDGKVSFGAPVFKDDKLTKNREIFEFGAGISMSLHYEKDKKINTFEKKNGRKKKAVVYNEAIVFDHISSPGNSYDGQRQFYGPDLSFDAYYFKSGKWLMLHNVDIENTTKQPAAASKRTTDAARKLYEPPKK